MTLDQAAMFVYLGLEIRDAFKDDAQARAAIDEAKAASATPEELLEALRAKREAVRAAAKADIAAMPDD
jgi:hypothetical protein